MTLVSIQQSIKSIKSLPNKKPGPARLIIHISRIILYCQTSSQLSRSNSVEQYTTAMSAEYEGQDPLEIAKQAERDLNSHEAKQGHGGSDSSKPSSSNSTPFGPFFLFLALCVSNWYSLVALYPVPFLVSLACTFYIIYPYSYILHYTIL